MDIFEADEYYSLADEKFDFDVSLSPASNSRGEEEDEQEQEQQQQQQQQEEEEDDVFGPPGRSEGRVGAGTEPTLSSGVSGGEEPSWSPLLGESFESIRKEANSLAIRLGDSRREEVAGGGEMNLQSSRVSNPDPPVEQFVEDPRDKLGLLSLSRPSGPLSPIKRETFCVRDSPLKLLPPALQPHLPPPTATVRPRTRLSTSSTSSPAGPKTRIQTRMSLRGKTGLGVLPNRPPPPSTLSSARRSGTVDRPGRPPPTGKGALGLRRVASRGGSCEDLLSDTASVTSDASDCSLDSSMQGRRTQAPPPGKTQATNTRKGVETRRHASSSSLSCLNSSLSVSPTGKSSSSLVAPPASRPRRSLLYGKAAPSPATTGTRRSLSTQLGRPSEAGTRPPSVGRSTPVKRAEPSTPAALTPAKRLMERASSSSRTSQSSARISQSSSRPSLGSSSRTGQATSSRTGLASSSKTGLASSSKTSQATSSRTSLASSKTSQTTSSRTSLASSAKSQQQQQQQQPVSRAKPNRLDSTCSVDSLPQRVEPPTTPSSASAVQWRPPRSNLPTPSGRRLSSIPTMTPRSLSRIARPGTPGRAPAGGAPEQVEEEQCFPSGIQPFSLEEEEPTPGLDGPQRHPSPPPTTKGPGEPDQEDKKMKENQEEEEEEEKENQTDLMELQSVEDLSTTRHNKKQDVTEVLLVDIPAPVQRLDEKLLIDLSNTPDLVRTNSSKPCGGQLIDLSSPLIKWSPEEKVNTGVLINISF